jgi:hypothetical protein
MKTVTKALDKYSSLDKDDDAPESCILQGIQKYNWTLMQDVTKQVKEKLKDLTVDEVITKVDAETKSAYKAAAKRRFADIIESVLV